MAPPPPSWIILGNVARVSGTDAGADDLPLGTDIALALAAPPRVTLLTVTQRVSPDPDQYPMVLALDPSGLILLSTPPPPTRPSSPRPCPSSSSSSSFASSSSSDDSDGEPVTLNVTDIAPRPSRPSSPVRISDGEDEEDDGYKVTLNITDIAPHGYYVCDAFSATRLPDYGRGFLDDRCAGIIASPAGDGHYMVVELQPLNGSDEATLLCFSSATGEWEEKDVAYPPSGGLWCSDAVIAHGGRLCWVDLSWGILSCDPFADEPVLDFVEIPEGRHRSSSIGCLHCADRELSTRRCVQVSGGMFRLVELTCGDHGSRPRGVALRSWMRLQQSQSRSHRKAPRVVMWTLADSDAGEWKVEHKVSFADIWADDSYKETGLPKKAPPLALVHPKDPDVVYFFLGKHIFGVDLRARKVVECEVYKLVGPRRKDVSSRCVRACELPAALRAGVPNETGSCVNGDFSSVPADDS
uniref:Uncharacterized protein n=1 Tax=Avena sativa TaxID=4498 RepID=A0ACD5VWL3_AVESA